VACIWQEAEQVVAGVGAPRLRGLVQGRVPRALWAREVQAFGPRPRARCHRAACMSGASTGERAGKQAAAHAQPHQRGAKS
jgi:hypothetical protein